jgi:hypothetical protein
MARTGVDKIWKSEKAKKKEWEYGNKKKLGRGK